MVSEQGSVLSRNWKCCMIVWLKRIAKSSLAAKPAQKSAFQQDVPSNVPCQLQQIVKIIVCL